MDFEGIDYDFDAPDSDWNYEPSRAELFRQIPAALYTTDAEGWLTYYNDAAAELWGCRPVLGKARWCGAWRLYETDGSALPHDACPMAIALREGRAVRGVRPSSNARTATRSASCRIRRRCATGPATSSPGRTSFGGRLLPGSIHLPPRSIASCARQMI